MARGPTQPEPRPRARAGQTEEAERYEDARSAAVVREILRMYSQGWFPMAEARDAPAQWVQPNRRALIPLDESFRVSRSLRARVRSGKFVIRCDSAFEQVIRACAQPGPGRADTWINDDIIAWYTLLHRAGHAHSIEAYLPNNRGGATADPNGELMLVGGLYGVTLGAAFCGESMFSRPSLGGTDASKVCLVHLVHHLRRAGVTLLDAQLQNAHTDQFGAVQVARTKYLKLLGEARTKGIAWPEFDPSLAVRALKRPDPPARG